MLDAFRDLKTVWATGGGASAESQMEEGEISGLVWNMLLLKKPDLAAAA